MNTAEKHTNYPNKIAAIEALPPFPLLSNIIKAFLSAENYGEIRPLIDNVETEPNLVAKVIGVANSAAFGNQVPVRSLKDAVIKLGVIQLKSLLFSIIIGSRFDNKKCPAFDSARFWQDSMLLACCASLMVNCCDNVSVNRHEVYSIALVLRIGLLALINIAPHEMNEILSSGNTEDLLVDERNRLHGIDHFGAGAILLKHWHLPEEYCAAVSNINNISYSGEYYEVVTLLRRAKELLSSKFMQANPIIDSQLGITSKNMELLVENFEYDKSWILSFSEHL